MKLYQCYTSNVLNDWKEISLSEFQKKFPNKEPKFKDKFYVLFDENRNYMYAEQIVSEVFYDHVNDVFVYIVPGGQFKENDLYETYEEILKYIKSFEGTTTLYVPVDENNNVYNKIQCYGPETKN